MVPYMGNYTIGTLFQIRVVLRQRGWHIPSDGELTVLTGLPGGWRCPDGDEDFYGREFYGREFLGVMWLYCLVKHKGKSVRCLRD